MPTMTLQEFIRTYDLFDKGVGAITGDEAGRVDFVFELFHCDDPLRDDEAMTYRLTATFRRQDVVVHEGDLWHEEGAWLGTVLDLEAGDSRLRLGIDWKNFVDQECSWTSLSLCGDPLQVEEVVGKHPQA